jgi:hypothetical protein
LNKDNRYTCIKRSNVGADSTIKAAAPSPSISFTPVATQAKLLEAKMKSLFENAQNTFTFS